MNIALFADVGNLYYCVGKRFEGGKPNYAKLDYAKLYAIAASFGTLSRAFAYGSQVSDEAINFINCLKKLGYDPKYKCPKTVESEGNKIVRKSNWNVGIAMDVVRMIEHKRVDVVILASADADLVPLVQWVKDHGVRCIVLACGISRELKDAADQFIEIGEEYLEAPKTTAA